LKEVTEMPEPSEQNQEWEPEAALMDALESFSLVPGVTLDGDLAGLKPHLEDALGALERLERRRDLSETEKVREEALRMLLASIQRVRE
jgi:hypothetical protein